MGSIVFSAGDAADVRANTVGCSIFQQEFLCELSINTVPCSQNNLYAQNKHIILQQFVLLSAVSSVWRMLENECAPYPTDSASDYNWLDLLNFHLVNTCEWGL